jgi:hypothetical protein
MRSIRLAATSSRPGPAPALKSQRAATGGDRKSKLPRVANLKTGRSALAIPGTSRARLQKPKRSGNSPSPGPRALVRFPVKGSSG